MSAIHSAVEDAGRADADEHVGAAQALLQVAADRARVGDRGQLDVRRDSVVVAGAQAPSRSTTTTSVTPAAISSVTIAVPAAPAPETTTRTR